MWHCQKQQQNVYTCRNCFQSHITLANSVCASNHGFTWKMWKRYFGGQNDICCDIKISVNRVIWKNSNDKNQQHCTENHQTFPKWMLKYVWYRYRWCSPVLNEKDQNDKCCLTLLIAAFCCFQWLLAVSFAQFSGGLLLFDVLCDTFFFLI